MDLSGDQTDTVLLSETVYRTILDWFDVSKFEQVEGGCSDFNLVRNQGDLLKWKDNLKA